MNFTSPDQSHDNASRVSSFGTTGPSAATHTYSYDDGQLTSKTGGTAEAYTYDDNGIRKLITAYVSNHDYVPGPTNRFLDNGLFTYEYDKEGNVIKRTLKDDSLATTEYGWDHRVRLVSVTEKNSGRRSLDRSATSTIWRFGGLSGLWTLTGRRPAA